MLDSDIDSYLRKIAMRNCQIQIHAIGDRGNQMVLNAYEKAYKDFPKKDLRWRIEHAQNVIEADRKRFKGLNIIASMQPSHAIGDLHFAISTFDVVSINAPLGLFVEPRSFFLISFKFMLDTSREVC